MSTPVCGIAIAAEPVFELDIPAMNAAEALNRFASQTGAILLFPYDVVHGRTTNPIKGRYTLLQGLELLLRDTGLSGGLSDRSVVSIKSVSDAVGDQSSSTETAVDEQSANSQEGKMSATNPRKGLIGLISGAMAALFAGVGPAEAQDSTSAAGAIEEITVTARRKSENLQDVPVAISAFSSEQLKGANITNLDQLAPLTPGLNFGRQNESRPQIYIRGVGSRQFDVGSEGSVGVFVDEVYVGRFSAGLSGLGDVERVEVLKGPQGTLYGRNTIGGAINIITKAPTDEFTIDAEIGAGNFDYRSLEGAISGPLIDNKLSGRLSLYYRDRAGYVTNLATGTRHNPLNHAAVRGKLLFTPRPDLDILLTVDHNRADPDAGLQGEYVAGLPVLATPGFLPPPITTPSRFDENYNTDSRFERDISSYSLRGDWSFDSAVLTSISAYSEVDLSEARDLDSTRVDGMEHITDENSKQFTQEMRLASTPGGWLTFDDRVDWILGVFYLKEEPKRLENLRGGLDSVFSRIAASIDAGGPPAPLVPGEIYIDNFLAVDVETASTAVFGQSTVDITEKLALTVGARYTYDKKKGTYAGSSNRDFVPPIILPFEVKAEPSWNSFDPKVTLEYHWTDQLMTYVLYGQGFKSGGFQFAQFSAEGADDIFDPETVKTYEIGMKSGWFDNRTTLNTSYFYYDYSDLQVARTSASMSGAPSITTQNAASATVRGFELEGRFLLSDELSFNLGYAYLDAIYDEYVFNETTDFSGNRLVRAPENSFNATLEYSRPLGDGYLDFRSDYSWVDDYFFEPDEGATVGTVQKSYALVNASASYEHGPWTVSVWGKNLTDEVYRTTTLSFGAFTMEYLGLPRTYGLTVGWRNN